MKPALCHLNHEEFWVLFLNAAQVLSGISQLSKGGVTATIVDVRLLLKKALDYRAVSLILVHNHPSGQVVPSASDRSMTERVVKAAGNLDIKVLDHLIVSEKAYFSFADQQLL
jgi:DNA repair protein RadC